MTFGENLYNLRKNKGWSQDQVANKIGVSRQAVSKWELSESFPDIENLSALSTLFSVTVDDLLNNQAANDEKEIPTRKPEEEPPQPHITTNNKKHYIFIIIGVLIIGILCCASSFIPSHLTVESVVTKEDISFIYPGEEVFVPDTDTVSTFIETYGLIPFLSTYHLYWLFAIGLISIIYGVVSTIKQKKGMN